MRVTSYGDSGPSRPTRKIFHVLGASEGLAVGGETARGFVRDAGTPANDYDGDVNSLLTYTSPSTKYVRNSAGLLVSGTTLRTNHDKDGNPLGILVEPAATNYAINSEVFTAGAKVTVNSNATTAPDGTTTADEIVEDGTSGEHYANDASKSATSGDKLVWSVFVKVTANPRHLYLRIAGAGGANVVFDASTGALVSNPVPYDDYGVEFYSNDWLRIWGAFTCGSTGTVIARTQLYKSGSGASYAGDSTSGFYLWGRQLEVGTTPTSYIKTTGSSATRLVDDITLAKADFPYNSGTGTLTLNGSSVTPVIDGSDLDIAGTCIAEAETHLSNLTWVPS